MNRSVKFVRKKAKKRKPDRRIQRTRNMLNDALMSLVIEKGYEATTVQDILDRANLGRSTFYTHFRDKDELLTAGLQQMQKMIEKIDSNFNRPRGPGRHHPSARMILEHTAQHHRFYKAMLGKPGGEIVEGFLSRYAITLVGQHLKSLAAGKKTAIPHEILVHFIASSFLGILTWWLSHDLPYSPEEMDRMFHQLIIPALNAGLTSY